MDGKLALERLERVRDRIGLALRAAGRPEGSVTLLAVGKTRPAEDLMAYYKLGLRDFGENYAQELDVKHDAMPGDVRWHMIGHVQSNKASIVARKASWVHTVDRVKIAARLDAARPEGAPPLNALIEVNVSGEASKHGIRPEEVEELAAKVAAFSALRLRGLMCVAMDAEEAVVDEQFAAMGELMRVLGRAGHDVDVLSMGMTGDMPIAIRNGSTMVRIGSALFGPRS